MFKAMASDVYQLVRTTGGKLLGHWPTLIALVLAGFTAKLAVLKLALLAGELTWVLGVFVYAFTAAGLLAAVTLMFRSMVQAGPWPPFAVVLAPFLIVFVASDQFDGYVINPAREHHVTMDATAAAVLLGVIVLRWLMPLWPPLGGKTWAAWIRVGLDICWMSLVAFTVSTHPLTLWLAKLAAPAGWMLSLVFTVVIVPVAWLAVGVLALGLRPSDVLPVLRAAGVPALLTTGLIILAAQQVPLLLWQLERLIAGAKDPESFWQPLSGLLGAANSAAGVLIIVCVVGALLSRVLAESAAEPQSGPDGSGGHQTGVIGQGFAPDDPYGDRFGVGRRDEEDGYLVGI